MLLIVKTHNFLLNVFSCLRIFLNDTRRNIFSQPKFFAYFLAVFYEVIWF